MRATWPILSFDVIVNPLFFFFCCFCIEKVGKFKKKIFWGKDKDAQKMRKRMKMSILKKHFLSI